MEVEPRRPLGAEERQRRGGALSPRPLDGSRVRKDPQRALREERREEHETHPLKRDDGGFGALAQHRAGVVHEHARNRVQAAEQRGDAVEPPRVHPLGRGRDGIRDGKPRTRKPERFVSVSAPVGVARGHFRAEIFFAGGGGRLTGSAASERAHHPFEDAGRVDLGRGC